MGSHVVCSSGNEHFCCHASVWSSVDICSSTDLCGTNLCGCADIRHANIFTCSSLVRAASRCCSSGSSRLHCPSTCYCPSSSNVYATNVYATNIHTANVADYDFDGLHAANTSLHVSLHAATDLYTIHGRHAHGDHTLSDHADYNHAR